MIHKQVEIGKIGKIDIWLDEEFIPKDNEHLLSKIRQLKKLLNERQKYINKIHRRIKDQDNILFAMHCAKTIISKQVNKSALKFATALAFLDKFEYVPRDTWVQYMKKNSATKTFTIKDCAYFLTNGFIQLIDEGTNSYSITKKGVDYYENIVKSYYHDVVGFSTKKIKDINRLKQFRKEPYESYKNRESAIKGVQKKFDEGQLKTKREYYERMMQPFWSIGIKKIPKDVNTRHRMLFDFIMKKKQAGEVVDSFYNELLIKWTSISVKELKPRNK